MRVLVGCEYSARVRDAFRARGHDAYSVDLLPTEGDPEYHYQEDVMGVIDKGWDLLIAFPPCTHLSNIGAAHWKRKQESGEQQEAARFFMALMDAPVPQVAIENPIGYMNTHYRKPDQIIDPFQFGEPWRKRTCLWLRGLPLLQPTDIVTPTGYWVDGGNTQRQRARGGSMVIASINFNSRTRSYERSRTFQGIANAMAEQWGGA